MVPHFSALVAVTSAGLKIPVYFSYEPFSRSNTHIRDQPSGAQNQAAALQQEGIVVTRGNLGELLVDLSVYGWFPRHLPSEEASGLAASGDDMD
jgi:hypothetical protein